MEAMLWCLGAVVANFVIGAGVWASIDNEDERLFHWFKSCPPQIAVFAVPIVLNAWPIGLWFWWRERDA